MSAEPAADPHRTGEDLAWLRCADRARTLHEPLTATASQVRRWILVEQPGPWGRDAPFDSRMDPAVADALAEAARTAAARLLLIRRPFGVDTGTRRAFAVTTWSRSGWIEELQADHVSALADVDWSPLRRGESVGGAPRADPLLLVCTNGSHDACCAREGQPLTAALAGSHPGLVWESTHVGGCRFAGNLVCLPEGVYYGHCDGDEGVLAAAAHLRGHVHLRRYRGRSSLPFAAQAAESLLRHRDGLTALDAIAVRAHVDRGDGSHDVDCDLADGRRVTVRVSVSRDDPRALTCAASRAERPPRYALESVAPRG